MLTAQRRQQVMFVSETGKCVRTALLNTLHGSSRDSPVNGLGGVLDSLDGALASNGGGAEQAGLAGELLTEHSGVGVYEGFGVVISDFMCLVSRN
jgi:hypothetical protein